ncbi:class I SAM-dependent methyltransferase [Microvirga antarctica]|uniref:class I SAM-dependent methyltransferase n=1 Tax=Microvirga antarctica TaxID=2819233 RepID=UPI001B3156AF|nr:class I SAM-dependent methyltransferase [Microvirga antarctica]
MTDFSAEWLALREPADHAARNAEVLAAAAALFEGREPVTILDLGSGSGSNLRGTAPHLPRHQLWNLVDYDPRLLAAARSSLSSWADAVATRADALRIERAGQVLDVAFRQVDLAESLDAVFEQPVDLVTAAAFFDLVSAQWIDRFAASLAARRLPLYTVLIYNGQEEWVPSHGADAAVNEAFNAHQRGDKGFGPAAGPAAAGLLAEALRAHGYKVLTGDSPWHLGPADAALIAPLADGIADAAQQTGSVSPDDIGDWRAARRSARSGVIGHTDLLAIPPG